MLTSRTLPRFIGVFLLSGFLTTAPAYATILEEYTRDELEQRARLIVVGRCTKVRAAWNLQRTLIFTYATYEVENTIKGAITTGEFLIVKAEGGTVGDITEWVVRGPYFQEGERALLYLRDVDEPGLFQLVGLSQGKLPVDHMPSSRYSSPLPRASPSPSE